MFLAAAGTGLAAAGMNLPPVWQGYLEVQAQAGSGCDASRALPYRIPLNALGMAGAAPGVLVWGGMQTAQLVPAADGRHVLQMAGSTSVTGSVELETAEGGINGTWREREESGGCSFTEARLNLATVPSTDRQDALRQFGSYLLELHAASAMLAAVERRSDARAAAAALQSLAHRVPSRSDADSAIAQVFVEAAEVLQAMRERTAARSLAGTASNIYRRSVGDHPEFAALALGLEARLAYRAEGPAAARPLLDEAVAILRDHGRLASPAADSIFSQLGSWQLRGGNAPAALESFANALRSAEERGASPLERASAMSNLAAALKETGENGGALQLFRRALALAETTGDGAARLLEIIREHIASLNGKGSELRTRLV